MEVYLDNASSTKVSEKVARVISEHFQQEYANPSATHALGIKAKNQIQNAREKISAFLHCDHHNLFFTSGATESNNSAILHYYNKGEKQGKRHIVISGIEHSSVKECCNRLEKDRGAEVTEIPADQRGVIDVFRVMKAIRQDTCVVCIMAVNNETGVIQNIKHIASACKRKNVPLHMDATQAIAHISMDFSMFEGDCSFSFSGHKFHAPKGVGGLIMPTKSFSPLILGGNQENGNRAGTANVSGILGMSIALEESRNNNFWSKEIKSLKEYFLKQLKNRAGGMVLNGDPAKCIPNILNVSFEGVQGDVLVSMLSNVYGVYCSTGSSCESGNREPSRILKSMGFSDKRALGAVRFSFSHQNTYQELDYAVDAICSCLIKLRNL